MVTKKRKTSPSRTNVSQRETPGIFKKFIESASEAFVLLDENLNCLSINPAGARLLGMSKDELIGKNMVEVIPDIKQSGRYDIYMNVIRTGKPFYSDELIPNPKFGDKRLIVRAFKMGKGMGMIVDDATSLKRAEDRLKKIEHSYRVLFDSAIDGMFVIDAEAMKIVLVNEAGKKMGLLYGIENVTQIDLCSYLPPDDRDRILKIIAEDMFQKDLRQVTELRIVTPNGKEIWLSGVGTRIEYQGKLAGLVSVRDITRRKQLEEALRRSEDFFRSVIENALDGIVVLDMDGKIIYGSPSIELILGYKKEELIGTNGLEFAHPDEIPLDSKLFNNLTRMPTFNTRTEAVVKHKDGSWRIVEAVANPISRDNTVQGIVVNWRDVTERKRMEEELRNLSDHLQKAREAERALIARQIHDELGQVLTALKMDTAWLSQRLNPEQEPMLKKTKIMLQLIDRTIQTVRTLSSELSPRIIEDLGLEAALEWLTEEFENRTGIKCTLTLKSNGTALELERATAVFRIIQEALTNITRHANATKVKVSLREIANSLVIEVMDNGRGITKEQATNPRSFGLMGMRERAKFCGGEVEITGVPDKGTTVIARIPLHKEEPR